MGVGHSLEPGRSTLLGGISQLGYLWELEIRSRNLPRANVTRTREPSLVFSTVLCQRSLISLSDLVSLRT